MKIKALIHYTIVENIRQKMFYLLVIFGLILICAAALMGVIGGEQRIRILKDLVFFSTEFIALLATIFMGTTFIYDEIDNKSIYLLMSRPVPKSLYITGRYIGILLSLVVLIIFMTLMGSVLVLLTGGDLGRLYLPNTLMIIHKIAMMLSLAIFFGILTTSKLAAMSFAFFFWLLGHFSIELRFLADMAASPFLQVISYIVYLLTPHLHKFSADDSLSFLKFFMTLLYTTLYSITYLFASLLIFKRKEF